MKLLLDGVTGPDTLQTMNDRDRLMRAHNPLSLAYRGAFPHTFHSTKHRDIDAIVWNRDAWHFVYRHGIPPLNDKENKETFRKWSMEDDAPENGGEFVKFYCYFNLLMKKAGAQSVDITGQGCIDW